MKRVERRIGVILAGLVILLVGLAAAMRLVGLPAPQPVPVDGLVGLHGPVALMFRDALRPASLHGRLTFQTADGRVIAGRVSVDGPQVKFWPDETLKTGDVYQLRLAAGVQGQNGLLLRHAETWSFRVRPAAVLYLSPADAPELWIAFIGDSDARQLTDTGGRIFDYDVSPDGEQIIYSMYNAQGGIDLWQIGRDGGAAKQLLPCQTDWCINPALSPDGLHLAYSRRQAGTVGQPGLPHLWILHLSDLSTDLLLPDPNVTGFQPVWSPDGRYLAFNDAVESLLYILDWQDGSFFRFQASLNGAASWFSDSRRLFISLIEGGGSDARPYVQVFSLQVPDQQLTQVLGEDYSLFDYSLPVWSPDGQWLAVAMRRIDAGPGKGLWRMRLDGSQAELLSPGDIFTNGAYSWSPDGQQIVYQILALDSSHSQPEVWVWSEGGKEPVQVATNAIMPHWLP